jgi:hypothetical protein
MMAEEITGLSGDAYDEMGRIQSAMLAEFEAKGGEGGLGPEFFKAVASGDLTGSEELEEIQKMQYNMLERNAMDQLMETRSVTQTLQNKIADLLENIWLGVEHVGKILQLFGDYGGSDDPMAARQEAIKKEAGFITEIEKMGDAIVKKQGELDQARPGEKKAKLQELNELKAKQKMAREELEAERQFRKDLGAGMSVAEAGEKKLKGKFGEEAVTPDLLRELGLGDRIEQEKGKVTKRNEKSGIATEWEMEDVGVKWGELTEEERAKIEEKLEQDAAAEEQRKLDEKAALDAESDHFKDTIAAIEQMDKKNAQGMAASIFGQSAMSNALEKGNYGELKAAVGDEISEDTAKLLAQAGVDIQKLGVEVRTFIAGVKGQGTGDAAEEIEKRKKKEQQEFSDLMDENQSIDEDIFGNPVKDFIYQGDGTRGTITPINSRDSFFGAMPGGAMDMGLREMVGAMMGGGGGGDRNVSITINGGDEERVYSIVKRVLHETGYGNMRSY